MTAEVETAISNTSFNWLKHIWNIKTPPKIKDFLWKLVRKAIPVSSNLTRSGIPAFNCKTCDGEEDDMHVFLTCSIAEQVWNLAPMVLIPNSFTPSMMSLLEIAETFTTLPPVGLTVPLWPWILWSLWKARNKRCFENKTFSAMEIMTKAITDAKDWEAAQPTATASNKTHDSAPALATNARASPTSPDTLICNVDAAWDGRTGNCGIGGVFSSETQRSIPDQISTSRKHVSSALMAEAIAIRSAVMYTASLNIKSLMILSLW
ncbi:uncharacterized protein LOC108808001 [Raphanus sativus]|uniref:Uncharacterized protein LOC108808001 n=1 Tax=Raphanus sativus TaxID=3726 RepID=A0A6J0JJ90_RAPSA|nr:uncharacterized protein LOC108808001 [Raphanus sativus]